MCALLDYSEYIPQIRLSVITMFKGISSQTRSESLGGLTIFMLYGPISCHFNKYIVLHLS